MNTRKGLVLDANILIRAVLGRRVRSLLETYEDSTGFYAPDVCFEDARKYIPGVLTSRGEDPDVASVVLEQIRALVTPVHRALYQDLEQFARRRVATRDEEDWPVVAVALLLDVPIWTEDQDFSAAASRPGPPIVWSCISKAKRRGLRSRTQSDASANERGHDGVRGPIPVAGKHHWIDCARERV